MYPELQVAFMENGELSTRDSLWKVCGEGAVPKGQEPETI